MSVDVSMHRIKRNVYFSSICFGGTCILLDHSLIRNSLEILYHLRAHKELFYVIGIDILRKHLACHTLVLSSRHENLF